MWIYHSHTHAALLGWITFSFIGMIYIVIPSIVRSNSLETLRSEGALSALLGEQVMKRAFTQLTLLLLCATGNSACLFSGKQPSARCCGYALRMFGLLCLYQSSAGNEPNLLVEDNVMGFLNRPYVTVTIPMYNNAPFIGETINSVLSQTFTDFELLIYDDHSTDGSYDIAASLIDPRIKLFRNRRKPRTGRELEQGNQQGQGKVCQACLR